MPRLPKARKLRIPEPANDVGVPPEELLLAKLVQNTKARGLRVLYGPAMWPDTGEGELCAVCALGAAGLEPDTSQQTGGIADGHEDWGSRHDYSLEAGYQAGAAFADAVGGRALCRF